MEISINEVKTIADSLPIGLYAKRRVKMEVSNSEETSYYSPITDSIVLSYPIIAKGFERLTTANADEREQAVRSMLYHEVGHAILTCSEGSSYVTPQFNIFEDERLETVLKDYFLNVDFVKQVYAINGVESNDNLPEPQSVMQAFYHLVRFHKGDADLLKKVEDIIKQYASLNRSYNWEWNRYRRAINDLYEELKKRYPDLPSGEEEYENEMSGGMPMEGSGSGSGSADGEDSGSADGKGKDGGVTKGKGTTKKPFDVSKVFGDGAGLGQSLDKVFSDGCTPSYDDELYKKFEMIISNFNKKNNSGSALNGYSGVFNPRLTTRDDYRYFERKASVNGTNKFGTFHLNLFLDNSGSFCGNRDIVNAMLGALVRLERVNKNFSFNVVHCGVGEELITDKNKYGLTCDDGTSLDDEAETIYRKLQKGNTYNYNIVLYDGSCYNSSYPDAFKAFNHANCTIISDPDNRRAIERHAPSAKQIITNNYTEELLGNILTTLEKAFR